MFKSTGGHKEHATLAEAAAAQLDHLLRVRLLALFVLVAAAFLTHCSTRSLIVDTNAVVILLSF